MCPCVMCRRLSALSSVYVRPGPGSGAGHTQLNSPRKRNITTGPSSHTGAREPAARATAPWAPHTEHRVRGQAHVRTLTPIRT